MLAVDIQSGHRDHRGGTQIRIGGKLAHRSWQVFEQLLEKANSAEDVIGQCRCVSHGAQLAFSPARESARYGPAAARSRKQQRTRMRPLHFCSFFTNLAQDSSDTLEACDSETRSAFIMGSSERIRHAGYTTRITRITG
jgi:hypothetical protein